MSSGALRCYMPFDRANRPNAHDFALAGAPLPNERESKRMPRLHPSGYWGKTVHLKIPSQIFSKAASFQGQKALDSRLVGWILLAALLWVLGDLGT